MHRDDGSGAERRARRETWRVRIAAALGCLALHAAVLQGVRYQAPARPAAVESPRRLTLVAAQAAPPPSPAPPALQPVPDGPSAPPPRERAQAPADAPSAPPAPQDAPPAAAGVVDATPPRRGWTEPTLRACATTATGPRPRAGRALPGQAPPHAVGFAMRDPTSPRDVVGAAGALLFGGGDPCAAARSARAGGAWPRADDPAAAASRAGVGAVAEGCDRRDLEL
uniref:Uncharacterized protein n=1 Tax=Coralloluteibacterium stylophorae TaxID=1776034 RepID=A0A8J8AZG4_9GAMM